MENLQQQMVSLSTKLNKLIEQYNLLDQDNVRMKKRLEQKEDEQKDLLEQIQKLEEENKKLKVVSAISGNQEYKKLMKLKLNKLIKEVDLCIIEAKSNA